MAGISSDVLGKIILTTYQYFPDLFSSNYTLGQILTTVRSNGTFMTLIANSTGVTKETLTNTVDLYLMIREYMQPTTAPITPNETDNASDSDIFTECNPDVGPGDFTNFTLLPALLIIFVLSFLSQRKRSLNCCGRAVKRPGLCIPVNLVDSYENRFAFACAFGATTIKCLGILFFGNYDEIFAPTIVQLIEDPSVPGWMAIIWKIIAMFVIGLAYYPLFACMATDFKITGLAIGFVYSACWVAADVAVFVQCPQFTSNVFPMDIFLFQLPVTLCLLFITLRYFVLLIKAIYRRCSRTPTVTEEEDDWKISYKYKYVLKLLEPVPKEQIGPDGSLKQRFKGKLYKWKPEFKYSTRVVCTYFISFIGIYEVLLLYIVLGVFILKIKASIPEDAFQYLDAELGITGIKQWFVIGAASLFVAVVITAIYSVVLMANMLSWYRGHLFRLQRGEKDFLPMKILSANPSSITVATLKYCGYQVAYLLWGVTICVLLLTVVGFVVGQQLIVPMVHGRFDSFLWEKIKNLWPAFVISLVFFWIQLLLSKYVFLMDRGTTLALNNRRLFHVCTFFLFFFNIFLGVISCLKRILIGAVLGVMFLGRTQKSVISRDYEMMDPGFNAYLGYLFLEHTHANPVLVTFCQLLIKSLVARQRSGQEESGIETNHALQTNHVLKTNHVLHGEEPTGKREIELNKLRQKHSRRVRNRWYLLMTLHNNPSIQEHRRSELFIVKSPFAAFQVVIQQGVTQQLNQEQNVRKEAEVYDIKL